MRLLILTQKVDKTDPILGFFHRWIEEFAKKCEKVTVICLFEGVHSLPNNVRVLSLGKEKGTGRLSYVRNFYRYIWQERNNYDKVFVHMNPEYAVLGGLIWRLCRKRISLWYVHRQSNFKLWLASKFAHTIFTSSRESFNLRSRKVNYLGHGIDTSKFSNNAWDAKSRKLIHIGRITPIKNCEVLITALSILNREGPEWDLEFIGEPVVQSDYIYWDNLKDKIREYDLEEEVVFVGTLNPEEINKNLTHSFASVNLTPTGGMDKAVLESLSAHCPVFTSNTAFKGVLGEYSDVFIFPFLNAADLARRIKEFDASGNKEILVSDLSKRVRGEYDVTAIIGKIISILNV